MARIVHLAIKVSDIDKATAFYEKVYGFRHVGTEPSPGHVSRHLSDGTIDLALMQYDSESAPEATLAGRGPCLHHFGIEVDDPAAALAALKEIGCEIISGSLDALPIKYRAPDGTVAEIVSKSTFRDIERRGEEAKTSARKTG